VTRWPIFAIAAVSLLLSVLERERTPALAWWTTHALEKIRPSDREPEQPSHTVKIFAARNEFEPFQIALRTESQDIDGVDVDVTDLRGPGGAAISKDNIYIYREQYLNLTIPSSMMGGTGDWPDPLIPRIDRYANEKRNAFPFKLIDGRTQPVWVDVYVPPSSPAGSYRGEVRIIIPGRSSVSVPLDLEVWNFQLPSTSSLPTTFGFSGNTAVRTHYGRYTKDKDVYDLTTIYSKAALRHRITLDGSAGVVPALVWNGSDFQIRWDQYDRQIGPFLDGGIFAANEPLNGAKMTSVAMHLPQALKTPEQQIRFWREVGQHFRKEGWFDRLFNYVWDEPKPADFSTMLQLAKTVRRADPALKNLVTAPLHTDWSDVIDIWTPLINCFERKAHQSDYCTPMVGRHFYEPEIAKGKNLWWYQTCSSHGCGVVGGEYFRGWPSYMIDDAPVRNRIMEWLTWKYGIQGELYFATNESYAKKRDPWKDVNLFGGNGDGTLFYPGRPDIIGGSTHIPIESIRLKLIREGLEDYEYLVMLARLKGSKAVADSIDGFIRNTYDYDQDPRKLYSVREEIGRQISALSK